MEDLGEQVGRKLACAVGSDLPSGFGYRASRRLYRPRLEGHRGRCVSLPRGRRSTGEGCRYVPALPLSYREVRVPGTGFEPDLTVLASPSPSV